MKKLKDYENEGTLIKITPDNNRAKSLFEEAKRKLNYLDKKIELLKIDDENSNDYIEDCYNILLFLIRSKMLLKGYKSSGHGAHEAEVRFSENFGLNQVEIETLDELRYFRNRILYYGKKFDEEYAKKIIKFTKNMFGKIKWP